AARSRAGAARSAARAAPEVRTLRREGVGMGMIPFVVRKRCAMARSKRHAKCAHFWIAQYFQ
ncbi:hypothetical protein, partial [Escherichia coli]|uniref:hypothetical protein n=1 Tax=Escherichia coli TaxID=562 RepID=UPI001BE3E357